MEKTVLCYIENDNKYLMLYRNKKHNDINHGKWIGVGGHIEDGETSADAIKREIIEETGLSCECLYVGRLSFYYEDVLGEVSDLFISKKFSGILKPCQEGELKWIDKDEVLSLSLWEGDRLFLPLLINEKYGFNMKLYYDKDNNLVRSECYDI